MPTKLPTTTVKFKDEKELAKIRGEAEKSGLSVSNYFRRLAGLEPLKHGGSRRTTKASK